MHNDLRTIAELIAKQKPGFGLEQRFYTDPEVYSLEQRRVLGRNWVLAGHQSELLAPGDFKLVKMAQESAIIVRGEDDSLRAFANVCRHRGSLVCLEPNGKADRFVCPYHGWVYGTDGELLVARNMPNGFDKSRWRLHPVALDVIGGLVFVCFTDDPPALAGVKRDLAEPMAMFDFENLKVAAHRVYDIAANWKLAVENYQECYHCAGAHPEYARRHTLMANPSRRPRLQASMLERMESCGVRRIEINCANTQVPPGEMGYAYSRTALFPGYVTGSKDGKPIAPLLGGFSDYDGGASDFTFGGFSFLLAYSDHVVCYVFTPIDAGNCRCELYWLVRSDAEEGRDYDVDKLIWLWDVTTLADKRIITNNWQGVQSRYYSPGPFSDMEYDERDWTAWYLREMARP